MLRFTQRDWQSIMGIIGLAFLVLIIISIIQHNSQRKLYFKHFRTGQSQSVRVGFNWVFFWFGGFLGIPLFVARLSGWGVVMLIIWAVNLLGSFSIDPRLNPEANMMLGGLQILTFILQIHLGVAGNKKKANALLEQGFKPLIRSDQDRNDAFRLNIPTDLPKNAEESDKVMGQESSEAEAPPPPPLARQEKAAEEEKGLNEEGTGKEGSLSGLEADLEQLKSMYDKGLIEEDEYQEMRKKKIEAYK